MDVQEESHNSGNPAENGEILLINQNPKKDTSHEKLSRSSSKSGEGLKSNPLEGDVHVSEKVNNDSFPSQQPVINNLVEILIDETEKKPVEDEAIINHDAILLQTQKEVMLILDHMDEEEPKKDNVDDQIKAENKVISPQIEKNSSEKLSLINNDIENQNEENPLDNNDPTNIERQNVRRLTKQKTIALCNEMLQQIKQEDNKENQQEIINQIQKEVNLSKKKKSKKENKEKVVMKDNKVLVNLEEIEKQYLYSNVLLVEGDIEHKNSEYMSQLYTDMQMMHPRVIKNNQPEKYRYCVNTGWFCCCGSCARSDIEKLGIGMICYFKILKVFLICFLLISIFNIPLYYIYYSNHTEKTVSNYRDALFKTTIGNIGSVIYNCMRIPSSDLLLNRNVTFTFDCLANNFTSISSFGTSANTQADIDNLASCTSYSTIDLLSIDSNCDMTSYINQYVVPECKAKQNCSTSLNMTYVNTNCKKNSTVKYFYLTYSCYDDVIELGYGNYSLRRGAFGFIVVGIDIFSILILLICMFIISRSQLVNDREYKEKNIFISDYTLHLTGMNIPRNRILEEIDVLILHMKKVLFLEQGGDVLKLQKKKNATFSIDFSDMTSKVNGDLFTNLAFYDINYPTLTSRKLSSILEFNKLSRTRHALELELAKGVKNVTRVRKIHNMMVANEKRVEELRNIIKEANDLRTVNELYLTFRNQNTAGYYFDIYNRNKCKRCCLICCGCRKKINHLYFKDEWLDLQFARDEPTNINWENITYNQCKRCLRLCVSIFIAILILLISIGIVIAGKYSQDQISSVFNTDVDCTYIDTSNIDEVKAEYTDNLKQQKEKILSHCFCNSMLSFNLQALEEYKFPNTEIYPCKEWVSLFLQFNSVVAGIVIIIPVVNILIIIILRVLTSFEKNKTLSMDLSSNMWKMFILQFINSGFVLVIVNMKIDAVVTAIPDFPLFTGRYTDLDPAWYSTVGVTILFTMILNIIMPHLSAFVSMLFNYMRRCCDSGCSCGKRTKCKTKNEYFRLYAGPFFSLDVRYAEMLTTIFVALIYSSGIPILYPCVLGYLLLTYIVDKYLILNFYKNPPKYDLYISHVFNIFIICALVVHYLFAIWIYGNPNLLSDRLATSLDYIADMITNYFKISGTFGNSVVSRLVLPHNIICLIVLAGLIIVVILRLTFLALFLLCCNSKRKKESKTNLEIGLVLPIKSLYKSYEIRKIQLVKLMRRMNTVKTKADDKSAGHSSVTTMKSFLQMGINYDREFLKYRLEKLTGNEYKNLDNNFDSEINLHLDKFHLEDNAILSGDVSYNIAYLPEFESVAYYEYLKNLN